MTALRYISRLERIDQMIRQEKTGNAPEFAKKINLSERQLYNLLDELKDLGLPVVYSRFRQTFYYEYSCRLVVDIKVEELKNIEYQSFNGGESRLIKSLFLQYNCSKPVYF